MYKYNKRGHYPALVLIDMNTYKCPAKDWHFRGHKVLQGYFCTDYLCILPPVHF